MTLHTRHTRAGLALLACAALGFTPGCGASVDDAPDAAQTGTARQHLDKLEPAVEREAADALLLPAVLAAVASEEYAQLDELLASRGATRHDGFALSGGAGRGYLTARVPSVIRHVASGEHVEVWSREPAPLQVELHREGAAALALTPSVVEHPGGGYMQRIAQVELPGAGVLLIGASGTDLAAMGDDVLAVPVLDERWACASVAPQCEAGDHACVIQAHEQCIAQDLSVRLTRKRGGSAAKQLAAYINKHNKIHDIEVTGSKGSLDVQVTFSPVAGQSAEVSLMEPDGTRKRAPYAKLETLKDGRKRARFTIPEGTSHDALILVDTASGESATLGALGAGALPDEIQAIIFPWEQTAPWTVQGCLRVLDDDTVNTPVVRPVQNAQIRLSGSRAFGVYSSWVEVPTDANGCFVLNTVQSVAPRALRVRVQFDDQRVQVRDTKNMIDGLDGWFFTVWEGQNQTPGVINVGAMQLGPNQPGNLGVDWRQRQAITFFYAQELHRRMLAQDPWFGFNEAWTISYPDLLIDGLALGVFRPTIYMQDDPDSGSWVRTLLHETGHIWHYMHQSGMNWNILADAIIGGTHGCQESKNTAFLEGFAEFFEDQVSCHPAFWIDNCSALDTNPRVLDFLRDTPSCNTQGLTTPDRVVRNDDGVTHALNLLVADDFYRRDFMTAFTATNWLTAPANVDFGLTLDPTCEWFTFDQLDLFDVLTAMRANPAAGYPSDFSTSPGWGVDDFYTRFRDIHNLPVGFLRDRLPYLDVNTPTNPAATCNQSCQVPASWWDGSAPTGSFDGANCQLMPLPAGGFVTNNTYYASEQETCPQGTMVTLGATPFTPGTPACHVHTPAPGTTGFVSGGGMYTTPITQQICPIGTLAGSGPLPCFVGELGNAGAPGDDLMVHESGGHLFADVDSLTCGQLGGVPSGPNQCDLGDLQGAAYLVHHGMLYVGTVSGGASSCPDGVFDGQNCYLGHPAAGTSAFLHNGQLHTTTLRSCAQGVLDATGCQLGTPPAGRQAFVWGGSFYFTSN